MKFGIKYKKNRLFLIPNIRITYYLFVKVFENNGKHLSIICWKDPPTLIYKIKLLHYDMYKINSNYR